VEVWRHLGYKHTWGRILTTRVEAYYYRAYYSNTAAGVLKTQLQTACKLYNTLSRAEKEEYEKKRAHDE
jgi:hypothetical protein